eukprot:CAMPEP_0118885766 /NCGR_PEP_ID=MMETSP1163-20130328/24100_1 /TAXON_ID=124430 /ORGANISM="Phaeomonas parva, Strain CCMP2877" /LENGTH=227 /DNA_ID=CAMNT_0006823833 /DNA_START=146 /DNA_END=829 /DNA_ORIENTATION=+
MTDMADWTEVPSDRAEMRALAMFIVEKAREAGIKIPSDDAKARPIVGKVMMAVANRTAGSAKVVPATLAELQEERGLSSKAAAAKRKREAKAEEEEEKKGDDGASPSKKKKRKQQDLSCAVPENQPLHDAFKEFEKFYWEDAKTEDNKKWTAMGMVKLTKIMRSVDFEIASGKQLRKYMEDHLKEDDPKVTRCCGKKTQQRIDECLQNEDRVFADLVTRREQDDENE